MKQAVIAVMLLVTMILLIIISLAIMLRGTRDELDLARNALTDSLGQQRAAIMLARSANEDLESCQQAKVSFWLPRSW